MREVAFERWAASHGGLQANSAASYVDYLKAVETDYVIDLDRAWNGAQFGQVKSRLSADKKLNAGTRRNRMSALSKYQAFCSYLSQ